MHTNDIHTPGVSVTEVTSPAEASIGLECQSLPIAISVEEFCRLSSLGRTSAYKLLRDGLLERRRIGGRTLILMRSVVALLELRTGKVSPVGESQ